MPTLRPYTPIGSYPNKRAAEAAAKVMSNDTGQRWIPCKGNGDRFAIVRKDAT
jgi:hypothetical protein